MLWTAVIDPNGALLRDRAPDHVWKVRLRASFDSQVRGPVFEAHVPFQLGGAGTR